MKQRLIRLGHYAPHSAFVLMPIGMSYVFVKVIPGLPE